MPLLLNFSLLAPFYLGVLFICFLLWLWCLVHLLFILAFDFLSVASEFLQVFMSSCINSLRWILFMAFDIIGVAWEFLQVPTSSSINLLTYGFFLWLLTLILLENLTSTSFHVVVWKLLWDFSTTINVVAIVSLSIFYKFCFHQV